MGNNKEFMIYDIETLPFGCQVKVKYKDGKSERAIAIIGGLALESGSVLGYHNFDQGKMKVYLGW